MNLPFLLVRAPNSVVVPVLAGLDRTGALVGYDLVFGQLLSFDLSDVVGAVNVDPSAVFYGMSLEWARGAERMAAEDRGSGARRGWEHRRENDEAVRRNIDPGLWPLWERVKLQFRGTPDERTAAFMKYVEDHPDEQWEALQSQSDKKLATMIRHHATNEADSREIALPEIAQLPIGSLLWWNNGPGFVVVPGGLAPVSMLPERADSRAPDGEPVESFGGTFTLIARGSGTVPTKSTAQRKVMAWWEGRSKATEDSRAEVGLLQQLLAPFSRRRRQKKDLTLLKSDSRLHALASSFLLNTETESNDDEEYVVDGHDYWTDPRAAKIVRALRDLKLTNVEEILGAGTFGTAARLSDGRVLKVTSDPSEVQAGHVLKGKRLKHVVEIYGAWFVRGVRVQTIIDKAEGELKRKRMHVGVLVMEQVTPLDERESAMESITNLIQEFKYAHDLYPHELASLSRDRARKKLRQASEDLQIELENQSKWLRDKGMHEDAKVATDIAAALGELRAEGVFAIDAHGGNIGFDRKTKTFKLFDIGTSSSPRSTVPVVPALPADHHMPLILAEEPTDVPWVGDGSETASDGADAVSEPAEASQFGAHLSMTERTNPGRMGNAAGETAIPKRFEPKGFLFSPINSPLFSEEGPIISGFPEARPQLMRHREHVPSVETIAISAVFAGSTIRTNIRTAERAFRCIAEYYEKHGRHLAPLAEIEPCLPQLGLIEGRRAMYEGVRTWAVLVQDAMKRGLRDRELRKYLYMETTTPHDISLAKVSFTLALLGQNVVCLDARILSTMYGGEIGAKLASDFSRRQSELTLRRYEEVEDAFLSGNPFYRRDDPIGRARAQWMSWESVGRPARPESHSAWLSVVR